MINISKKFFTISLIIIGLIFLCFTSIVNAEKGSYSGDTDDGYIWFSSFVYNTAHNSATGNVNDVATLHRIGQLYSIITRVYVIDRTILFFNVSDLNSTLHDIACANLRFYVNYIGIAGEVDMTIIAQWLDPSKPLVTGDYLYTNYSGNYGSVDPQIVLSPLTTGFVEIDLNQDWIDDILYDKYLDNNITMIPIALRTIRDINSLAPNGNEYVDIYSADYFYSYYHPTLRICYVNKTTACGDFTGSEWFNATEKGINANCLINYSYWENNCTFNITGTNTITSNEDDWLFISGLEFGTPTLVFFVWIFFVILGEWKKDWFYKILQLPIGLTYGVSLLDDNMYLGLSVLFGSIYILAIAYWESREGKKEE